MRFLIKPGLYTLIHLIIVFGPANHHSRQPASSRQRVNLLPLLLLQTLRSLSISGTHQSFSIIIRHRIDFRPQEGVTPLNLRTPFPQITISASNRIGRITSTPHGLFKILQPYLRISFFQMHTNRAFNLLQSVAWRFHWTAQFSLDGTLTSTLQLLGHVYWRKLAVLHCILHKTWVHFTLAWSIMTLSFTTSGIGFGGGQHPNRA